MNEAIWMQHGFERYFRGYRGYHCYKFIWKVVAELFWWAQQHYCFSAGKDQRAHTIPLSQSAATERFTAILFYFPCIFPRFIAINMRNWSIPAVKNRRSCCNSWVWLTRTPLGIALFYSCIQWCLRLEDSCFNNPTTAVRHFSNETKNSERLVGWVKTRNCIFFGLSCRYLEIS